MTDYSDQSFFLGLRRVAGIRSVAPAVKIKDPNYNNQEVFVVQKDKFFAFWGCEMAALRADCIRIQYRASFTDPLTQIKNYLTQTSFTVTDTPGNPGDIIYTEIDASPIMPTYHWLDSSHFNYTKAREHDMFENYANLLRSEYSDVTSSSVTIYNFARALECLDVGYYEIELDETNSAFYRGPLSPANRSISTPEDQSDYNLYKTITRGPWTPVDYSRVKNGRYLKRKIIVKCVDNKDPLNESTISTTSMSVGTSFILESALNPTTAETVLSKPNLKIKGTNYPSDVKTYMIDFSNASNFVTVAGLDMNITVSGVTTCKNLRNRKFEHIHFDGNNSDFVKKQTGSILPVDMRNTTFKSCVFTNITFGTKEYNQLIMDGCTFEGCTFENCKFYLKGQNIFFYQCDISGRANLSSIFNFSGSDGNAFVGVNVNLSTCPFNFDNTYNDNLNNFFLKVYVYHGNYIDSKVSFLKSTYKDVSRGTFTGNIFVANYNKRTVGDPINITSSASQNLFVSNFFRSPGSISLGKDINKELDPKNQYYSQISFSGGTQPTEKYLSWNNKVIATYSGARVTGNLGSVITNGRAFPWEENPIDPVNSSPWHNIIYEHVIGSYKWGMRSFFLFFPFGGHRDDGFGYCGATEYLERKNKFTNAAYTAGTYKNTDGTTPDYQCPSTWKGFKEAVRALIEGRMTPSVSSGREAITEPCNVTIYLPSFMGFPDYREQTTTYWNSLGANDAARDAAFTTKLNDYISDLIYMAGSVVNKNKGKLSICFDAASNSATANNISLYRTMTSFNRTPRNRNNATSIFNESFLSGVYKTDILELSDWNVKTALENAGITVFAEARPTDKQQAQCLDAGNSGYQGVLQTTLYDSGWKNFAAGEYWMWVSDPENPTRNNANNVSERAIWENHIKNNEASIIFRIPLNGIENYFFTRDASNVRNLSSDPFGLPSSITHSGQTRNFKNWSGINLVSSPFWYLHVLYGLSDHYRLYNKLKYNSSNRFDVKLSTSNYIALPLDVFAINHISTWADNSSQSKDKYYVVTNSDPTVPATSGLFYSPDFNSATYLSNPATYSGGFWIKSSGGNWEFWNNNVRKRTFSEFVDFIKRFSDNGYPISTTGKTGSQLYANDYWSQNILKDLI
jgi:hypothetical protein